MPSFNFKCNKCGKVFIKLLKAQDATDVIHYCPHDNNALERDYGNPSTISKEVIESPLWPKKVEQYSNSAELIEENEQVGENQKNNKDL